MLLYISLYTIGCFVSYLIHRYFHRKRFGEWTTADRSLVMFKVIFSWVGLLPTLFTEMIPKGRYDKEAKW